MIPDPWRTGFCLLHPFSSLTHNILVEGRGCFRIGPVPSILFIDSRPLSPNSTNPFSFLCTSFTFCAISPDIRLLFEMARGEPAISSLFIVKTLQTGITAAECFGKSLHRLTQACRHWTGTSQGMGTRGNRSQAIGIMNSDYSLITPG